MKRHRTRTLLNPRQIEEPSITTQDGLVQTSWASNFKREWLKWLCFLHVMCALHGSRRQFSTLQKLPLHGASSGGASTTPVLWQIGGGVMGGVGFRFSVVFTMPPGCPRHLSFVSMVLSVFLSSLHVQPTTLLLVSTRLTRQFNCHHVHKAEPGSSRAHYVVRSSQAMSLDVDDARLEIWQ